MGFDERGEGVDTKEFSFSTLVATAGTMVSACLGGWDKGLRALAWCIVLDYAFGLLGAIKNKNVDSEVMFWGGIRKGIILAVVSIAVTLDGLVGNEEPVFRTLAVYFYVGREGLSIAENLGILGVPVPGFLKKILAQLQEKGEGK
jgi:toxin secretion/phage lysis holin